MTNNEKDRHVAAAAVREKLNIIITFNLKDFKPKDLSKWDIKAWHPQQYLLRCYAGKPQIVMTKLAEIGQKKEQGLEEMLLDLNAALPKFSNRILKDIRREINY